MERAVFLCLLSAVWLGFVAPSRGDDGKPAAASKAPENKSKRTAGEKAARAAAQSKATRESKTESTAAEKAAQAMTFATEHHPELAALLTQTKSSNPKEFDRAMQDIYRASERLNQFRKSSPERHALELDLWKIESRVRLLAARFSMSEDAEIEQELRKLLVDRRDVKRQVLELERAQLQERLARVEKRIADQQSQPEGQIDREMAALKRSLPRKNKSVKTPNSPASATVKQDSNSNKPEKSR